MTIFDDLLAKLGPQDSVAHLGPSILYEQFRFYRRTAARVFVVEPDPARAADVRRTAMQANNIELFQNAIVVGNRNVTLRRYNFDALTGLCDPGPLKMLFPGLRETQSIAVDGMPIETFVASLPKNHRRCDLLVIDSLGEEFDLLEQFDAQDALARFFHLVVRLAPPASSNSARGKQLRDWLAARHYDRPIALDASDPDLPVLYFQRNPLGEDLAKQTSLVESLRAQQQRRDAALSDANAQARKADSDLRVALRLQSAAQDDLKDLQRQYADLRADKERQDELLRKVTQKLAYASDYLRRLAIDAPEIKGLMENAQTSIDEEARDTSYMGQRKQKDSTLEETNDADPPGGEEDS